MQSIVKMTTGEVPDSGRNATSSPNKNADTSAFVKFLNPQAAEVVTPAFTTVTSTTKSIVHSASGQLIAAQRDEPDGDVPVAETTDAPMPDPVEQTLSRAPYRAEQGVTLNEDPGFLPGDVALASIAVTEHHNTAVSEQLIPAAEPKFGRTHAKSVQTLTVDSFPAVEGSQKVDPVPTANEVGNAATQEDIAKGTSRSYSGDEVLAGPADRAPDEVIFVGGGRSENSVLALPVSTKTAPGLQILPTDTRVEQAPFRASDRSFRDSPPSAVKSEAVEPHVLQKPGTSSKAALPTTVPDSAALPEQATAPPRRGEFVRAPDDTPSRATSETGPAAQTKASVNTGSAPAGLSFAAQGDLRPAHAQDAASSAIDRLAELATTASQDSARTVPEYRGAPEPATARPIVNQIVHAVARTSGEGTVEIRLQPEELGRVRLSLIPSEAGVSVTITAERAETLDLLRRNIDMLEKDLTAQGFEDLTFLFGSEQSGPEASGTPDSEDSGADNSDTPSQSLHVDFSQRAPQTENGRLDIRV